MDTPKLDRTARVQQLLHSLIVVSAELGPDFIHSEHGTTFLSKALLVLASVGGGIELAKSEAHQ